MSVPHGCTDDMDVVETFKEALQQRIGPDRFRMWFTHGVSFAYAEDSSDAPADPAGDDDKLPTSIIRGCVLVKVRGQFALDRLRKNFLRELRGAAMQACGSATNVAVELAEAPPAQAQLPMSVAVSASTPSSSNALVPLKASGTLETSETSDSSRRPVASRRRDRARAEGRGKTMSMSRLIAEGAGTVRKPKRPALPAGQLDLLEFGSAPSLPNSDGGSSKCDGGSPKREDKNSTTSTCPDPGVLDPASAPAQSGDAASRSSMTAKTFVAGSCNQLAYTAMTMVCQQPGLASPLFICGPTGTGKSHMLSSIADQFRRVHRMRRVMHLSAEQFTNDFITSVGNSGITSFRRRYREVDALLIDDVQFLGAKKATLREMLYTVETLSGAGRPLVFSGSQAPTEIDGLTSELAGRMAAGLVCPIGPLDLTTRETILRRRLGEVCAMPIDDATVTQLTGMLAGDGRVISGVVNTINLLQRMYGRTPTLDEIRRFGGDVLRSAKPVANLSVIETAVCDAFQLPMNGLRTGGQSRAVTEPRMLAMYLSRQMTSAAYTEIARHFGGKSHSTAIAAEKNVKGWIVKGKSLGRGPQAMSAQEAIERIENLLRA